MNKNHTEPTWHRLGARIKHLREERSWSQRELARRTGVSQTTISEMEAGTRNPSAFVMMDMAKAFDVDIGVLLLEDDEEEEAAEAEALRRVFLKLPPDDQSLVLEMVKLIYRRSKKKE